MISFVNTSEDLSCLHLTQLLTKRLTKLFVNTGDDLSCLNLTKLLTKLFFNSGDDLSCLHSTQLLTQLLTKLFVNTGDDLSCLHQASARIFGALGTRVELSKGGASAREGEVVIREGHGAVTCPLLA